MAYYLLVEGMTEEQRAEVDEQLAGVKATGHRHRRDLASIAALGGEAVPA